MSNFCISKTPVVNNCTSKCCRSSHFWTGQMGSSTRPLTAYSVAQGQPAEIIRSVEGWILRTRAGVVPLDGVQKAAAWLIGRPAFTTEELSAWFPMTDPALLKVLLQRLVRVGLIAPRGQ
jgi:hypothetical protein